MCPGYKSTLQIITKLRTSTLLWRVPNFAMIDKLQLKPGRKKFSATFEFNRIRCLLRRAPGDAIWWRKYWSTLAKGGGGGGGGGHSPKKIGTYICATHLQTAGAVKILEMFENGGGKLCPDHEPILT